MKTSLSLLQVLFILFVSMAWFSCEDEDYDFDKLNKEAVFSPDGINVPIGSLDTIFFKKLVEDLEVANLYWDNIGRGFVQEDGNMQVDLPTVSSLSIQRLPYTSPVTSFPSLPSGSIASGLKFVDVQTSAQFPFDLSTQLGDFWEITVDSIAMSSCVVDVSVFLPGLSIVDNGTPTTILVKFSLSPHFESLSSLQLNLQPSGLGSPQAYRIHHTIEISKYRPSLPGIPTLYCSLEMLAGSNTVLSSSSPGYQLGLLASMIQPNVAYGRLVSDQSVSGNIDLSSLKNALEPNDVLLFDKAVLRLDVTTNLGTDFAAKQFTLETTGNVVAVPDLSFTKPSFSSVNKDKNTVYYLAEQESYVQDKAPEYLFKAVNPSPLFANIPQSIQYDFQLKANDPVAYLKWNQDLKLSINYDFTAPLSFSTMRITLKDTLKEVFSEELIKRLFDTGIGSGDIEILASVDVFLKQASASLRIQVEADIIDEDGTVNTRVPVVVSPATGLQLGKDQVLSIQIKKEHMPHIQEAKDLALTFILEGANVEITDADYIFLQQLRVKKEGGIYFEF